MILGIIRITSSNRIHLEFFIHDLHYFFVIWTIFLEHRSLDDVGSILKASRD